MAAAAICIAPRSPNSKNTGNGVVVMEGFHNVPDAGASIGLLGLALAGLGIAAPPQELTGRSLDFRMHGRKPVHFFVCARARGCNPTGRD